MSVSHITPWHWNIVVIHRLFIWLTPKKTKTSPFNTAIIIAADDKGWVLLSQFPPFSYVLIFFLNYPEQWLSTGYHIHIWQLLLQFSWSDTSQIWMWFEEPNIYFCKTEDFHIRYLNECSFSKYNPWPHQDTGHQQEWYWHGGVSPYTTEYFFFKM